MVLVKVLKAFADEGLHAGGVAEHGAHLQESLQESRGFAGTFAERGGACRNVLHNAGNYAEALAAYDIAAARESWAVYVL
jgi:ABC-type transporter Mla subunit MlaD